MESLCRLCGSEDGIMVDIFQPGTDRVKKIHKILPITVNEHDPFPKKICHHCSYKVDQFFDFRLTSIKTQETFRRKVPWLRDKQHSLRINGEPPMVEVNLNSVNIVSPNEKQISPARHGDADDDDAIVIDDSPPYVEHSNETSASVSEQQNPMGKKKSNKSKSRSLWDTKRRKKRSRKSCRIEEVFTLQEFQGSDARMYQDIDTCISDPLRISPVDDVENVDDENNSAAVNSPRPEAVPLDDKGGGNIVMPSYMLVTKIPSVGKVYTCEMCGRTFLTPLPASQHHCPPTRALAADQDRPKEEPQHQKEDVECNTTKDFYHCSECGDIFTRHSQLVTHQKKHDQAESSSDDNFRPFNSYGRRKHHTRRKHKQRLLNTSSSVRNHNSSNTLHHNRDLNNTPANDNYNNCSSLPTTNHYSNGTSTNHNNSNNTFEVSRPNLFLNFESVDTKITRHSLLSSDESE